ncbi:hypothetical protein AB1K18_12285 [Peribacillus simplex]|uniref:hypothetical protein n=1 Tax=Peribacillus simplex TaxID=1478 RepID=UPI003B8DD543
MFGNQTDRGTAPERADDVTWNRWGGRWAKVADKIASGTKFVPYSKEFAQKQVQKVQSLR